MNTLIRSLAAAGLLLLAAGSAAAAVNVTFVHPERFADVALAPQDRDQILREVAGHFAYAGKKLPPGYDLNVEVQDLDMAGRIRPNFHSMQDIRILRGGADWPSMHLRYSLEAGGRVVGSGDMYLRNMDYLQRINRYSSGDQIRYERQMIDDWYRDQVMPMTRR